MMRRGKVLFPPRRGAREEGKEGGRAGGREAGKERKC